MNTSHVSAILGFAFVAAWIGFGFGEAVHSRVVSDLAYGAALVARGEIDLGQVQHSLRPAGRRG